MNVERLSVLIVEDHDVLSQALAVALGGVGFEVTVAADLRREQLIAETAAVAPTVTLLDLHLGIHGTSHDLVSELVATGTSVVVLTASEDRASVATALRNGASAFVQKSEPFDRLVAVVRDVAAGAPAVGTHRADLLDELRRSEREQHPLLERFRSLTSREQEVLAQLVAGSMPAEIAATQFVAVSTVRSQLKAIYRKLGVNSQVAVVALTRRAGWSLTN